jgi:asparagine synthase (glutamine-hydrolysing)
MCGISGLFDPRAAAGDRRAEIERMSAAIAHRGPDGSGCWHDPDGGLSFGHRRLAIVDLTELGAQPMASSDGRYILALNGEIYNFPALRRGLESRGAIFRGDSDTEVLLELIARDGLRAALEAAIGMFALALWDRVERRLALARDRMGEKPLYYGYLGGRPGSGPFAFASELRALRAHSAFAAPISRDAAAAYMRLGYVPEPDSIFAGIAKLPPGHFLSLTIDDLATGNAVPSEPYWQLAEAIAEGRPALPAGRGASERTDAEWVDGLEARLAEAVRLQLRADVPLGAFLSGGIDSTTVVALMQKQSARPIKTFTIGFERSGYDEAPFARAIARRLGTDHHELYARAEDALAAATQMPRIYDEPFADSSQVPTYLVSRLARESVTVSLSGDGGDELFGGYNRYVLGERLWAAMRRLPLALRRPLASALLAFSPGQLDRGFALASAALPRRYRFGGAGNRLHKLARALEATGPADLYAGFTSLFPDGAATVEGGREAARARDLPAGLTMAEWMMAEDALSYLPGDILAKVDRAAMACGLEARVPFLDRRVVEFAWQVPLRLKIRDGQGKWLLRQVLARHVPLATMDRPKTGFSVPLDDWLRGPLRDWAESALSESALARHGILRAGPVRRLWQEHLSGRWNRQGELWCALMLQEWLSEAKAPLAAHAESTLVSNVLYN